MIKTFRAKIMHPYQGVGKSANLIFTKSELFYTKDAKGRYVGIKDERTYTLLVHDRKDKRLRYEIKIDNNTMPIRLIVNNWNTFRLKWVHNLLTPSERKSAFLKLIVAIIAMLIGLLRLIVELI